MINKDIENIVYLEGISQVTEQNANLIKVQKDEIEQLKKDLKGFKILMIIINVIVLSLLMIIFLMEII